MLLIGSFSMQWGFKKDFDLEAIANRFKVGKSPQNYLFRKNLWNEKSSIKVQFWKLITLFRDKKWALLFSATDFFLFWKIGNINNLVQFLENSILKFSRNFKNAWLAFACPRKSIKIDFRFENSGVGVLCRWNFEWF